MVHGYRNDLIGKIGEEFYLKYREFVKKEKISDFFQKALDKFRFL